MSIEKQAVRVAAAAAALVEDCQRPGAPQQAPREGLASRRWWDPAEMVLGMVRDEQHRRGATWGERRRPPVEWLMVLAAEVGDLAEAIAAASLPPGGPAAACDELRRAAASARQWLASAGGGPAPR